MKLFAMERELRIIKNRGHFQVPTITPQGTNVETSRDRDKVLKAVEEEVTEIIQAVRKSEENYEREQEEAKNRDQQLGLTRQVNGSDYNFLTMVNSTPIRNGNTRTDQPAVHFDTNATCHFYPATNQITNGDWYEPPVNNSIIQGAGSKPGGQFTTSTTSTTGHKEPWRYNNRANTATHTNPQGLTTRTPSCNSFHNNSPNSSDNRNGPTCFKCGEQGHMSMDCREIVFCTHCRTSNHDTKACRKHHSNAPSTTNSHIPAGYHPTAKPPPLMGATTAIQQTQQTDATNNRLLFQNLFENNQPRTSTAIHTPFNGASPAPSANMTEALTQVITQVTNNNKKDEVSKQMMKNNKIFDSPTKQNASLGSAK